MTSAPAQPAALSIIDNQLHVLILQHPQERREILATAAATCARLRRATLAVGLSWPNLPHILGRRADAKNWAVLYLGSARPGALGSAREIMLVDRRGRPVAQADAALHGLAGIVLLDGSWKEAKTLWWRNPWLLKLQRLVLNPAQPARYGALRREPRREALSTIEATALVLRHLDGGAEAEAVLLAALEELAAAQDRVTA